MKIAFLSFYSGKVYRGVETYVSELSTRLRDIGHKVAVFEGGSSKALTIKEFTKEVLRKIDKDTDVLVTTNGGWQSVLCKLWSARHGKKLVIPGQSGPGLDDRINLWTFPDAFVGLTKYQCDWARKVNPFVHTTLIPNGVDTNVFKKSGKPLKINLPHPIIMSAAALVPMKRLDLAIHAVSRLKSGSLLLVGMGKQEGELKKLGEELLPGRFQIMSFSHTQMPQVYKGVELFTFPTSPWESFGIAMLEAMASGVPIVATDDPIRREVVGSAGFFVDPRNTDEYAKTLEKALSKEWGNTARKQAEKFSWDEIAKQYDQLFRRLVVSEGAVGGFSP